MGGRRIFLPLRGGGGIFTPLSIPHPPRTRPESTTGIVAIFQVTVPAPSKGAFRVLVGLILMLSFSFPVHGAGSGMHAPGSHEAVPGDAEGESPVHHGWEAHPPEDGESAVAGRGNAEPGTGAPCPCCPGPCSCPPLPTAESPVGTPSFQRGDRPVRAVEATSPVVERAPIPHLLPFSTAPPSL